MNQIIKIINMQEKNVLDIRFWPTDICNYNCTYCFPDSHPGKFRYPKNVDTVVKNFRKLFDVYNERFGKNSFRLNLVGGGEPTLWPGLEKFSEEIKKNHDVRLQLTTNGSRSLRWWTENSHRLDKVVLSTHHEFADITHLIDVADYLYSQEIIVNTLVLMDAQYWDKCVSIVDQMKQNSKYPWIIEVKSVIDSPGKDINFYNNTQLEYMKTPLKRIPDGDWLLKRLDILNPFKSVAFFDDGSIKSFKPDEYISNKINNFQGWSCAVSLENLVIGYDGTVRGSCQQSIFDNVELNIFSETFEKDFDSNALHLDLIKCPFKKCGCTPDTHITKFRS
jgi:organic radical activating enzyme